MSAMLTERAAANAYADAWNKLDCQPFIDLLAGDARYASQYVLEELAGKDAIAEYLTDKFETVKDHNALVTATLCSATASYPGKPCVLLCQGNTDAVVVFETEGPFIRRFDLCITDLYRPAPVGAA